MAQFSLAFKSNAIHPNNFEFVGGEYCIDGFVSQKVEHKTTEMSQEIGKFLHSIGYIGMFGCDYMCYGEHIYFTELNPRYQASTFLINRYADLELAPHTLHIQAFLQNKKPTSIKGNYIKILKPDDVTAFVRYAGKTKRKNIRTPGKDITVPDDLFVGYELFSQLVIKDPYFPVKLNVSFS